MKRAMVASESLVGALVDLGEAISLAIEGGNKLLVFGNGGSAADSQHLAAELVGHYIGERRALPALALTADTSVITAIGNDFAFDSVFARQVEALGRPGDVALAITTSGNSKNVVEAVGVANETGLVTAGLTGMEGGELLGRVHHLVRVPSTNTQRIQEGHVALVHTLCDLIEWHLQRPGANEPSEVKGGGNVGRV